MKKLLLPVILLFNIFSCSPANEKQQTEVKIPLSEAVQQMLDSMKQASDTVYTKPYKRTDFVTATYYVNRARNIVCQVMKDSAGTTRQIITTEKGIRTFFAGYYANGQLQARLALDSFGQYHGPAEYYFENGNKQAAGNYKDGLHTGTWINYSEDGKKLSTDEYDNNGQKTRSENL